MHRLRLAAAIGIVGILAAVAMLAWPRAGGSDGDALPPLTTSTTMPATTATTVASTTSTVPATTTLSAEARKAEVEAILQGLWFGWFDAIYRKDPDALWAVVATRQGHEDGVAAMARENLFLDQPHIQSVAIAIEEILLDQADCLVVHHTVDIAPFAGGEAVGSTVSVLWPTLGGTWRFATHWQHPNDLWLADCDDLQREETP